MNKPFRKPVYLSCGYNTTYFGPGRNEFDPKKPFPSLEDYLLETAQGTLSQMEYVSIDQGVIGSFMSARFLKQANLPGFLPFMVPDLLYKPCTGVEGACGTGGRTLAMAIQSILSDLSDVTFSTAFEIQNTVKSVYGSDVLAGAAYYKGERKKGHAFFFPGIFAERAGAYYKKFGEEKTRQALAKWFENAIINARKNPKAQEYHNTKENLFEQALTPPDPKQFLPYLNPFDCSKVSDGASSLLVLSEEGLKRCGIQKEDSVELIAMGSAEGNITEAPPDLTFLTTTSHAVQNALNQAGISIKEIGILEVHDCFSISGLLSLEAAGVVHRGGGPDFVLSGETQIGGSLPVNPSGGLIGFGHPTGASGVRQMVDLIHQLTNKAKNPVPLKTPYGMMISMGGNDITVTCLIVKRT